MIATTKGDGLLNNLIGLLRFQTFNGDLELVIRKIKSHKINDRGKCELCGFDTYKIRKLIQNDSKENIKEILTCDECVIKNMLE